MGQSERPSSGERTVFSLISAQRSALMGFAALWIVVFHVWRPVFDGVPGLEQAEDYARTFGYYGVDMFFFLSGMGLVFSIDKHSLGGFYYRRLQKLALPYVAVGLARLGLERFRLRRLLALWTGYTVLTETMYRYLWFVQGIALLYLLFPLYYAPLRRSKRPALFTGAVLAVWLAATLLSVGHMRADLFGFTNRAAIFLLGVLLGEAGKRGLWPLRRWMIPAAGAALMLGAACGVVSEFRMPKGLAKELVGLGGNLFTSLGACVLLSALLERFGRALRGLRAVLTFFGGFSLEFYCVQDLYARNILIDWLTPLPPLAFNLAAIALATALGWGFWKLEGLFWKPIDKALARKGWLR